MSQSYNVIVNQMAPPPTTNTSSLGCFQIPSDEPSMSRIQGLNTTTSGANACWKYAVNNQIPYYGQDSEGNCYAGTSLDSLVDASREITVLWKSSNTSPASTATIQDDGSLVLTDIDGLVVWQSDTSAIMCVGGGKIRSATANYGANCVGQLVNVDCPDQPLGGASKTDVYKGPAVDLSATLGAAIHGKTSISYAPLQPDNITPDPAPCCTKSVDYSYQCGGSAVKSGSVIGGQSVAFDCTAESTACQFQLQLDDDGNARIYNIGNKEPSWATNTSGQALESNPKWRAIKGKWGQPYLTRGNALARGEWIGSPAGTIRLILDAASGTLLVQTSVAVDTSCPNGLVPFQVKDAGRPEMFGKLGLITPGQDPSIYALSPDMHGVNDPYASLDYTSIEGYDLQQVDGKYASDCEVACNANPDCGGFTWMKDAQTCFLKTMDVDVTKRKPSVQALSGVRSFVMSNDLSCARNASPQSVHTSALAGAPSTPMTECPALSTPIIPPSTRKSWDRADRALSQQTRMIVNNIQRSTTDSERRIAQQDIANKKMSGRYKEGMQVLNAFDLKRKEEDSILVQHQTELTCILWTALALGLATIVIKSSRV